MGVRAARNQETNIIKSREQGRRRMKYWIFQLNDDTVKKQHVVKYVSGKGGEVLAISSRGWPAMDRE